MYKFQVSAWKKLVFLLLLSACAVTGRAQIYPVQLSTLVSPPYSIYLPDYASPGGEKLRLVLLQRDLTVQGYRVRFEMKIQVNGVTIMQTSRSAMPPPIILQPGIPTVLGGSDLSWYVQPQNLEFGGGYSSSTYEQSRSLPEGPVSITFTAYDYTRSDLQVSASAGSFFYATRDNPPLLNYPACGMQVTPISPQFLNFSWLPQNTSSPNSALQTNYIFSLWAVLPAGYNFQDIVQSTKPLYSVTTQMPTLVYGPGQPPLVPGQSYAWRVQAVDITGRDVFRNSGYSETCNFNYVGDSVQGIVSYPAIQVSAASAGPAQGKVWWTAAGGVSGTPGSGGGLTASGYDQYRLYYRKVQGNYDWFSVDVNDSIYRVFDLEPSTTYECRLQGHKNGSYGPYTDVINFTTDAPKTIGCTDNTSMLNPYSGRPLAIASSGMNITYGPWDVQLLTVQALGQPGQFKGTCKVSVPFMGAMTFNAKFDRLTIDDSRNVSAGTIDFLSQGLQAWVDSSIHNQMGGSLYGNVVSGTDTTNVSVGASLANLDHLDVVLDDDSAITSFTIPGTPPMVVTVNDAMEEVTVKDAGGSTYSLDNQGNLTQLTLADGSLQDFFANPQNVAELNTLAGGVGTVTFKDIPDAKFAFDAWKPFYGQASTILTGQYEKLAGPGGDYYVPQKAIGAGESDLVGLDIDLPDNMDEDSLIFATGTGTRLIWDPKDYTLNLLGGPAADAQEVYALYPKPGGGYYSLAKLLVSAYEHKDFTAVLVPVVGGDGAVPVIDRQYYEDSLNSIYNKVNVNWTVELAPAYTDVSWDADKNGTLTMTGSSFLSSSLTGEPAALIKGYKSTASVYSNKKYIFIFNTSSSSTEEAGGLLGDMPRATSYGFVFLKANLDAGSDPAATVAHELGHGQFNLEHTFSGDIAFGTQGATAAWPNLMDYQVGNHLNLYKYQWNQIHQPGQVIGILESDAASQAVNVANYISIDNCQFKEKILAYASDKKLKFVTPDGRIIALPSTNLSVNFIGNTINRSSVPTTGQSVEEVYDDQLDDSIWITNLPTAVVMPFYGNGVLHGFITNKKTYEAIYAKQNGKLTFTGYYELGTSNPYPGTIASCDGSSTVICGVSPNPCETNVVAGTLDCGQLIVATGKGSKTVNLGGQSVLGDFVRDGSCNFNAINLLRSFNKECGSITADDADNLAQNITGLKDLDFQSMDISVKTKLIQAFFCAPELKDKHLDAISAILQGAAAQEQVTLIQLFRNNNYDYLFRIYKNKNGFERYGGFVQALSGLIETNFGKLGIQPTMTEITNFNDISGVSSMKVPVSQTQEFYMGTSGSDGTTYPISGGAISPASVDEVIFNDDRTIRLHEIYGVNPQTMSPCTTCAYVVTIDQAYDPFEPIEVTFVKNYAKQGLTTGKYVVPAIWVLMEHQAVDREDFDRKLRMAGDVIQVGAAILTGGESMTVATFITQMAGAVSAVDVMVQKEKNSLTPEAFSKAASFYSTWDNIHTTATLADGVVGLYHLGTNWRSFSQLVREGGGSVTTGLAKAYEIISDLSKWKDAAKLVTSAVTKGVYNDLRTMIKTASIDIKATDQIIQDANGGIIAELLADGTLRLDAMKDLSQLPDDYTVLGLETDAQFVKPGSQEVVTQDLLIVEANGTVFCVGNACFGAGTLVQTKDGLQPIESIRKDQDVLSLDLKTGKAVWEKVKRTFEHPAFRLVRVITDKDTLLSTPEHPYYTEKGWKSASQLSPGLRLHRADGSFVVVVGMTIIDTVATVYNLEVSRTHNYCIGSAGVVVHNDCALLTKLVQKVDADLVKAFEKDFAGKTSLLQLFDNGTISVEAWKTLLSRGTAFRFNPDNLTSVTNILKNSEIDAVKLKAAIDYAATGNNAGITGAKLIKKLDIFSKTPGVEKVLANCASANKSAREGAGFVLKVADEIVGVEHVSEFEAFVDATNADRYYDFVIDVSETGGTIKVECKSWSTFYKAKLVPQFLKVDLQEISRFDQLRYLVNTDKMGLEDWYTNMNGMLIEQADNIFTDPSLVKSKNLFTTEFKVNDAEELRVFLKNTKLSRGKWFDIIFNQSFIK